MVKGNTLKIYVLIILIFNGLKAYESYIPSGYQGCYRVTDAGFEDYEHFYSYNNTGKTCKRICISNNFRYAGTGGIKRNYCRCFGNLSNHEYVESDECDSVCPGSSDEICGGQRKMSVYDTWMCATVPCKNNGSCRDISSNTYKCNCRTGWTGTNCTDSVIETVTQAMIRQTQQTVISTGSSTITTMPTTATTTMQEASTITKSKQTEVPTTEQKECSSIADYISVPVVILVLIIVAMNALLICRRRHQINTPHSTRFRKDSTEVRSPPAIVNQANTGRINMDPSQYYLHVIPDNYSEIQPETMNIEESIEYNNE